MPTPETLKKGVEVAHDIEQLAYEASRLLDAASFSTGFQKHLRDHCTRLRGPRALRLREFIDKGAALGLMSLRPI